MGRINFYQLLELPINPPEKDAEIIDAAIKKKQSTWSRLRNHPTKGIQARHYISLLPEIRKVMMDSELLQNEADAAVEDLKVKLESIFKMVDRHIDLIGSKGEILPDEIEKIAAHHEIKPQLVQKRVARWQKKRGAPAVIQIQHQLINGKLSDQELDKIAQQHGMDPATARKIHQQLMDHRLAELDDFVNIQVRKGFMTQTEISGLAAVFPYDEGEILRRIRCPIKKSAKKEDADAYQLDATVEQVIIENLKIAGHDSLYSFLGLFPGTGLEALQNKAVAKENEIRKISQKDAILTASGVLVGQCISIFKSDESRYAYDLSRARLLLKNLNVDIDLAVAGKTIPREQYDYLVRQAIRFGTLPEAAHKHIREYCRSKGWRIVLPKKKLNLKRYLLVASIVLIVTGIGGGAFWYIYYNQQRLENEYVAMLAAANRQDSLEAQLADIQKYVNRQEKQEYVEKAQNAIDGLHKRIEYRDLKKMQNKKAELTAQKDFEKIATLIEDFKNKHPQSSHNQNLNQELAKLPGLIDKRDYDRLVALPPGQYADVAIAGAYYLREHPQGVYVKDVDRIARRMAKPYYRQLTRELKNCEKSQQWNRCVELIDPYIELYKDSKYAVRLRKKNDAYRRNTQGDEILSELRAKAGGAGADPAVLKKTYRAYLEENPYSPAREIIRSELNSLETTLNRQSIQTELAHLRRILPQTKGRFTEPQRAKATVMDKTTGLTWTMLDSNYDTRACMTYNEAIDYANGLKTGGYNNWRLPTAKELQRFYRGTNPFKAKSADWYWTANKSKAYREGWGWIIFVDIVAPKNHSIVSQRKSNDCGWVRAVRR